VSAPRNPIAATVDFETDGIQHGFLKLPHSTDASAWGAVMIPIMVAKRGQGPTALLTGANHGDEYEGPIALLDLARHLDIARVTGRIIAVPFMNQPAFAAGRRTSPLDGGNMNRIFPGRANGTPTEKIADYFQNVLLPMADIVLDIHSGGRTLEFLPFAAAHELDDAEQQARSVAAMTAFNAPYSLMMRELDAAGMYDTAAETQGKTFVTTELGGGGTTTAKTIAIAKRGVANLLMHAGILAGTPVLAPSTRLTMPGDECFVTAERAGLVEFCADLGDSVAVGDVVARVHDASRTDAGARDYVALMAGIVAGRHFPGLVKAGDTLMVIARPEAG
jgi:N-alpha-acetyl-L-2,4-diaminobutyrate deacetylase